MRISTWNLNRPPLSGIRTARLLEHMSPMDVDVWVLTETNRTLSPGAVFRRAAHSKPARDRRTEECWTAIWTRDGIESTVEPTRDAERTACVRLLTRTGQPLFVYGTVLPWLADQRRHPKTGVAAFREALAEQEADWRRLLRSEPGAAVCVVGDLNQSLAFNGRCHGSSGGERALQEALDQAELTCLTCGENDPVARLGEGHASIDHICIGGTARATAMPHIWPNSSDLGARLTDHYGVAVTLGTA